MAIERKRTEKQANADLDRHVRTCKLCQHKWPCERRRILEERHALASKAELEAAITKADLEDASKQERQQTEIIKGRM